MAKRKSDDDDEEWSPKKVHLEEDVDEELPMTESSLLTPVSKSGRVRKKSAKLLEMEAFEEQEKIERKVLAKKEKPTVGSAKKPKAATKTSPISASKSPEPVATKPEPVKTGDKPVTPAKEPIKLKLKVPPASTPTPAPKTPSGEKTPTSSKSAGKKEAEKTPKSGTTEKITTPTVKFSDEKGAGLKLKLTLSPPPTTDTDKTDKPSSDTPTSAPPAPKPPTPKPPTPKPPALAPKKKKQDFASMLAMADTVTMQETQKKVKKKKKSITATPVTQVKEESNSSSVSSTNEPIKNAESPVIVSTSPSKPIKGILKKKDPPPEAETVKEEVVKKEDDSEQKKPPKTEQKKNDKDKESKAKSDKKDTSKNTTSKSSTESSKKSSENSKKSDSSKSSGDNGKKKSDNSSQKTAKSDSGHQKAAKAESSIQRSPKADSEVAPAVKEEPDSPKTAASSGSAAGDEKISEIGVLPKPDLTNDQEEEEEEGDLIIDTKESKKKKKKDVTKVKKETTSPKKSPKGGKDKSSPSPSKSGKAGYSNVSEMALKLKTSMEKKKKNKKGKQIKRLDTKNSMVKRPKTAYMLWCNSYRDKVIAETPGIASHYEYKRTMAEIRRDFSTISKRLGEIWQTVPEKEKMTWRRKAKRIGKKGMMINTSKQKQSTYISKKVANVKPTTARTAAKAQAIAEQEEDTPLPSTVTVPVLSPYMQSGATPLDTASHLWVLGESLSTIGHRLKEHRGNIAVQGSLSVLLDSLICALGPLVALTNNVSEINGCTAQNIVSTLDNIAYIMPGIG